MRLPDNIAEIIKKYCEAFTVTPVPENKCIILMAAYYNPFFETRLDAYYLTSARLKENADKLAEELCACGIPAAPVTDCQYKVLAYNSGLMYCIGKNSLSYSLQNGSRTALWAVEAQAAFEYLLPRGSKERLCDSCNRCVKNCPAGAIKESGGLDAEKCLRFKMIAGVIGDDETAVQMGDRIWGCDICQRVCPMNSKNVYMHAGGEVYACLDKIWEGDMSAVAELIGKNFAKEKRLLNLSINAAMNRNDLSRLPEIEKAAQDPDYEVNARRALKRMHKPTE